MIKRKINITFLCSILFLIGCSQSVSQDPVQLAVENTNRTIKFIERDKYRNPVATLNFFGIKPDMKVLELSAGGGWYTEILAPLLYDFGELVVTHHDPKAGAYQKRSRENFDNKVASHPGFDKVKVVTTHVPPKKSYVEAGAFDMVLTFRNLHNWLSRDAMQDVMEEAFNALKSGGTFGVVEHRADDEVSLEYMKKSGYVSQALAIEIAEKAGFKLVSSSEINANPKDTKDHPRGVWTLLPNLRLGEKDKDKYTAIGESDRMTLFFVKD
jgi:predicted methyltransferase